MYLVSKHDCRAWYCTVQASKLLKIVYFLWVLVAPRSCELRAPFFLDLLTHPHRLNLRIDLQSLFGLLCTAVLLAETPQPYPPPLAFGLIYEGAIGQCAAKAFYSCPAIISRRPRSQNILKEPQLNPEKDSRRKQARSYVTLEKSS
jgi:hypothetical protein